MGRIDGTSLTVLKAYPRYYLLFCEQCGTTYKAKTATLEYRLLGSQTPCFHCDPAHKRHFDRASNVSRSLKEIFAENIRRRRIDLGLTQLEASLRMGLSTPGTINAIERGKYNPGLEAIERIAEALDTTPVELLS